MKKLFLKGIIPDKQQFYDIIFDAVGKILESKCKKALTPNGTYVTVMKGVAKENAEDLIFLKILIGERKIKSVIDRRYPLDRLLKLIDMWKKGIKRVMWL